MKETLLTIINGITLIVPVKNATVVMMQFALVKSILLNLFSNQFLIHGEFVPSEMVKEWMSSSNLLKQRPNVQRGISLAQHRQRTGMILSVYRQVTD